LRLISGIDNSVFVLFLMVELLEAAFGRLANAVRDILGTQYWLFAARFWN